SFLKFLNSGWRKLKKQLDQSYDFSNHQLKPSYSSILEQLQQEYTALNDMSNAKNKLEQEYNTENIDITYRAIETLRNKVDDKEIDYLLSLQEVNNVVSRLYKLNNKFQQLELQLQQCLYLYTQKSVSQIEDELENIAINMGDLPDLLPALKEFANLPSSIKNVLRTIPLTPSQTEAVIASKSLAHLYQYNRDFASTDHQVLERSIGQIRKNYKELLRLNADYIRASIRHRFILNLEVSNTALSQLDAEQKQFKKNYNEGRKILENEFGKSMRFKSIRELSAKESGLVLKDIKPVWLMSPLSVSDSLPVNTSYFDVVIFDEASQITLEEGVPSLFRSEQTIIVGDDKQMPPTNFFTSKSEDPDDLEKFNDESEEE
ncbi:MAG: DNA helicase, partial [Bacteroidetes bacterium]|nr:DNA helicase [Bacteroidota bacterium]